jgi:transposase
VNTLTVATYNELAIKIDSLLSQLHIHKKIQKTGRPAAISFEQAVTLGVYKQVSVRATKKSLYNDFKGSLKCSYKTLVVHINSHTWLIAFLVMKLLEQNRTSSHPIKHVDGSIIPVCLKKNAKHHKTMSEYAGWTKTSTDWYYGLKLHMVSDLKRKILNVILTPANTDERSVVIDLIKELEGLFIFDAGYVSAKLEQDIFVEGKRMSLIQPRTNMKKLATPFQLAVYQTRFQIEFNFRDLKMFFGLVTSLPRSTKGYFANYFYSLLGYLLS